MSKILEIDLTEKNVLNKALNVGLFVASPITWILLNSGQKLLRKLKNDGQITNDDAKNVETIIRAGRENNVKQMKIKLSKKNILGINAFIKEMSSKTDVNINLGYSSDSYYELEVEYR